MPSSLSLPPLDYYLSFKGTFVEIAGDGDVATMELSHPEEVDRRSGAFAAWALLPLAMAKGRDIRIHAGGDETVQRNFAQLSKIWATWMPHWFQEVKVTFAETYHPKPSATERDLLLYSGGIDSTYNLLLRHEAQKQQTLLTIHGIDYKADDTERFEDLVKKTDPLAQMVGSDRIFLKTNLYSLYAKYEISVDIGHAFVLATSLFVYGANHRQGEISSDFSSLQEWLVAPWGTSGMTNPLFASHSFRVHTANLDKTRAEKTSLIRGYPVALKALSFCKTYACRPENCGVCRKCTRTKAMFLAADGTIPEIFGDPSFDENSLNRHPLKRTGIVLLLDIYQLARRNGTIEKVPGLAAKINELRNPPPPAPKKERPKKESLKKEPTRKEGLPKKKKRRPWYRRMIPKIVWER